MFFKIHFPWESSNYGTMRPLSTRLFLKEETWPRVSSSSKVVFKSNRRSSGFYCLFYPLANTKLIPLSGVSLFLSNWNKINFRIYEKAPASTILSNWLMRLCVCECVWVCVSVSVCECVSVCVCVCVLLLSRFSRVRLCVTPETAAHQALPSLGFSRQEYGSGWPFHSPYIYV